MNYFNVLSFLFGFLFTMSTIPFLYSFLREHECLALNYKNQCIITGMGLTFALIQTIITISISLLFNIEIKYVLMYNISVLLLSLAGFIDDVLGEKSIKGFKGHIYSLLYGKITTGLFKALIGLIAALLFSIVVSKNISEIILNTLIITLFTNLINLFDLRPGRSSKIYIILTFIFMYMANQSSFNFINFSMLGILFAYLPIDLKSKAMMGDTGSNILGITLGIYCILTQDFIVKILVTILLLVFNVICEFWSISTIIMKNRVLNFFDQLGRQQ